MAGRRKRGAPVGLMFSPRPRERFRPCNRSLDTTAVYGIYVVVALLVSAALRRVLVTNSLLPLQSFIGHNYCIWYEVVVLLVSAALRSVLVTDSLLPLQSFIGHNCCIQYVHQSVVVLLVICTYVVPLRPTLFGHNCCIWYVVVVLLASAALRSV